MIVEVTTQITTMQTVASTVDSNESSPSVAVFREIKATENKKAKMNIGAISSLLGLSAEVQCRLKSPD